MNIKEKHIYYGLTVLALLILIVTVSSLLIKNDVKRQKNIESKLPQFCEEYEDTSIRVVIKTNGFKSIAHSEVELEAKNGLLITAGNISKECESGASLCISPDDKLFAQGKIIVKPKAETDKITIKSLKRGYGVPTYRGNIELYTTAEGIVIVNELLLEEYLYAVVPSEMPASYELEALKAQAVCARSYAYGQMQTMSYPKYEAHVDDSVSFQVYGNSKEQDTSNEAVDATAGECLWYNDKIVKAYYYSTSSGKTTTVEAWGTKVSNKNNYLQSVKVYNEEGQAYEKDLSWFQWKAVIPKQTLENLIELNTKTEIGELQSVTVTERGAGGVALQVVAKGSNGSVTVETENKIRKMFGGNGYTIEKQDGTIVDSQNLLPSAFFTITQNGANYILNGGGYGHGIGMSQNGANEMAKCGKKYDEILKFFYQGVVVE